MKLSFPLRLRARFRLVSKLTEITPPVSKAVSIPFPSRFPFAHLWPETGNEARQRLSATVQTQYRSNSSSETSVVLAFPSYTACNVSVQSCQCVVTRVVTPVLSLTWLVK